MMLLCVQVVRRLRTRHEHFQERVVVFALLKLRKKLPVPAKQKRRELFHREHLRLQGKALVQDGPPFAMQKLILVWDSCWLNGCHFLANPGGFNDLNWFGVCGGWTHVKTWVVS